MKMLLKKAIEFLYCLQFKKKLKFVFLFVILVFFSFSGLKIVYSVKSGTNNEIKQYNNQVYEKLKELQGSKLPTARDEKEAQIVYLLAQRKSLLLEKIKDNPAVLKDNALPKEIYAGLPDSAKNLVEKETKINGKLMILVADRPSGREEDYYEIKDEDQNKTFNLNFIESPHDLKSNSKVSVNGLLLEKELVLDSSNNPNIIVLETPPVASLISGTRNVLVIRQSFLDSSNPFSAAAMSAEVFTDADSSKNYYIENSYNQLTLAGDVVGPYTIPYNKSGQCLYNDWAEASLDAAIADGVNVNNYDHAAFVFADVPACAWAGLGHVDGPYTWYNGYNESTTYSHELGHNFGAYHAAMKLCGTVTIDDYANCTHYEYGDNWDVMGYSWTTTAAHFNAPHKIQMGWIPTERVQNITSSGTYTIYPVETTTSNIQALKIWKPNTDDYYYLEYRQAVGSDSWFATGITSGVVAHIWKDGVDPTTHLLDLTPADHTGSNFSLPDGSSFTDNVNGITITGVSHNATSVTVNVDIPDLSDIDHIDLTPSAPQTINAGTQLQFSAKAMDIGNHWITGITTYTWTGTDSNGLFTNSNAGDHNVRATYGGVNSPIVVVTVVMGNVYSIVLSPDTNQTITAGQTIQFTASARDYYNNVVPDIIFTWEGTNSSGLFNNTSAGAHSVRARYAAKSSNPVQITVNAGPVDHIYIDPLGNQTITAGQTIQFTPQSQDQYNNVISIPIGNYTWQNTNSSGLFNSTVAGTRLVKASYSGVDSDAVQVTVNSGALHHVSISPSATQNITAGQTIQFTGNGQDQYDNNILGLTYAWTGTNASGLFSNLISGTYGVKVQTSGIESSTVQVTVIPGVLHHVSISPAVNQTITAGNTVSFTSSPQDEYNNSLNLACSWTNTGAVDSGLFSETTTGNYLVKSTCSAMDSAVIQVTVNPGALHHFSSDIVANTTAGQSFSTTFTAKDEFENTRTSYSGSLNFSSDDTQAILPTDDGTGWVAGQKLFGFTLKTSGGKILSVHDPINGNISSNYTVDVDPSVFDHLEVTAPKDKIMPFSLNKIPFTVRAEDGFGNPISGKSIAVGGHGENDTLDVTNGTTDGNGEFLVNLWTLETIGASINLLFTTSGGVINSVPFTASVVKTGDFSGDSSVDLTDFSMFLGYWQQNTNGLEDISSDGKVDLTDFSIFLGFWHT